MKKPAEFLNAEGKKYARYIFLAHKTLSRVPWFGKYIIGTMVSLVYGAILKEGAIEHQRRKQIYAYNREQAKMSKMQKGASASRGGATREMRELPIRDKGLRRFSGVAGSSSGEPSRKEESSQETN
jgi:hypothetical protein